jgi:hypothetical protein
VTWIARTGSAGRRAAVAVLVSALVVGSSPTVGQIRGALEAALPGYYRAILVGGMTGGAALLVAAALRHIWRQPGSRGIRYATVGGAIGTAIAYAQATATGNPRVDAVERFHFLEYGLIALLFYRVWRERGDATALLLPAGVTFLVGIADEAVQWFVPGRVGELRDVLLNGVAIACGVAFAAGLEPPPAVTIALDRGSRVRLAVMSTAILLSAAAFIHAAHLGHELHDPDVGTFHSRFDAASLKAAAADRAARWRQAPPAVLRRYSREDQYLGEGLWHVQRRNEAWAANDFARAFRENLILEKYYAPLLMVPTYATPSGARWPDEQRAAAAAAARAGNGLYVSDANPYPIYTWNSGVLWTVAIAVVLVLWCACLCLPETGSRRSTEPSTT